MFKFSKKLLIIIGSLSAIFIVAHFVLAATPDFGASYVAGTGLSNTDPRVIAANIIRIALGFLGILAIALIIYGGFLWMTAAGDEQKVDTAKRVLISAIIGLAIILAGFGIATFVLNNLMQATGVSGSAEGGPCSASDTSCIPTSGLCQAGLSCGADCQCHGNIIPPNPVPPGGSCGSISFGVCAPSSDCTAGWFCATDCTCHKKTCSASLDPAVCTIDPLACGNGYYCDNTCACQAVVGPGKSCDSDPSTPACDANGSICDPLQNLFCDTNNPDPLKVCTCQVGNGVDQPCYTDPTQCGLGQNVCSQNLSCDVSADAKSCTCQQLPIIDWVSPIGGFCVGDHNKACAKDADCGASDTCDTLTPNAKPGNIISIGGRYFGTTPGTVKFFDGTGFNLNGATPDLKLGCKSLWSDGQIITVVPAGAKDGAIEVVASDGKTDLTNDSRGPKINDFVVNSIVRPGLCTISPGNQVLGGSVAYNGVNFSANGVVDFGMYTASVLAANSTFANENTGQATVPNFSPGNTTTFVHDNASGQNSNYVIFTNDSTPAMGSFISSFEPASGAVGQYVTIHGNGFGNRRNGAMVYFGAVDPKNLADFDFPPICQDGSTWTNQQIIVKVPQGIPDDFNGLLTVVVDNGNTTLTTQNATPQTFRFDAAAPLTPSLCKIVPAMGPAGTAVTLYGEYFDIFDAARSSARFSLNQPGNIVSWDGNNNPNAIKTSVPQAAVTGLVKIINAKNPQGGNGLNFSVGSCLQTADPTAACGGQSCCPAGTYKAGTCVDNVAKDCVQTATTSVYQFTFSTGNSTNPVGPTAGSCQEQSQALGACKINAFCPNSPGLCSLFPGGGAAQSVGKTCADSDCKDYPGCEDGDCVYDASNNKCVAGLKTACGLASTTLDNVGHPLNVYCGNYQGTGVYMFNLTANESCTDKYHINVSNKVCVNPNSSCGLCATAKQICESDGVSKPQTYVGICGAVGDVCPSGAKCTAGQCQKVAQPSCSCCCRKDPAFAGQDCCTGLKCEGTCGSNTDPNALTFGSCGGCKTPGGNQASWDANCNCTDKNTTGKFCDVSDPNSDGVCRDCAALGNDDSGQADCSSHAQCCVDATKGNNCVNTVFGSNKFDIFPRVPVGALNFCGYYQCKADNTGCDDTANPVAKPSTKVYFASSTDCSSRCGQVIPAAGASCAASPAVAKPGTCNTDICGSPLECLQSDGTGPLFSASPSTCGFCCCNPSDIDLKDGTNKECAYLTLGKADTNISLSCVPNVGPCSGAGRGLCCGCRSNGDCAPLGNTPATQGCGMDTCCRTRPGVAEPTVPADNATNVCRNAEIKVAFNQKMDASSFRNNFYLIEETANDCPDGTHNLAPVAQGSGKLNGLAKAFYKMLRTAKKDLPWVFGQESLADEPDNSAGINHCSLTGSSSVEQLGDNGTIFTFEPLAALDPDTRYFAVVRGVATLYDSDFGVENYWSIGMNATSTGSLHSPIDNTANFSGTVYKNSYIWSFKTKLDSGEDQGLCAIDHVDIFPDSYLFHSTANDLNENDLDPLAKTFDTAYDRDKVFFASAMSSNNDVLHPVAGYAWQWVWQMANSHIAQIINNDDITQDGSEPFDASAASQLIQAQDGIVNSKTTVTAKIKITDQAITAAGNNLASTSDIYVFLCTTTWPGLQPDGITWYPWRDQNEGSVCKSGNCQNTNYELYYCRDNGAAGNLPGASPVTTLGSNQDCTDSSGNSQCVDASTLGKPCGSGGTCQDLLKQSYFFSANLSCSDNSAPGSSCDNKAAGDSCGKGGKCQ